MKRYLQTRNDPYDIFNAFDDFFRPMFIDETNELRTNIKESETEYELDLELPGYSKDQIKVSLEKGYLTVSAEKESKAEEGKKYLRKEISETCRRSYFVGEGVTQDQIKAKFTNGILTLTVPKSKPKEIAASYIDIE